MVLELPAARRKVEMPVLSFLKSKKANQALNPAVLKPDSFVSETNSFVVVAFHKWLKARALLLWFHLWLESSVHTDVRAILSIRSNSCYKNRQACKPRKLRQLLLPTC